MRGARLRVRACTRSEDEVVERPNRHRRTTCLWLSDKRDDVIPRQWPAVIIVIPTTVSRFVGRPRRRLLSQGQVRRAKTKLASRAAAWLRDGRILVIPEIIITDQASPPSLGRRAEWISHAQPRPSVPFSPNSGREDCAELSSRTPARLLCVCKSTKTRLGSP